MSGRFEDVDIGFENGGGGYMPTIQEDYLSWKIQEKIFFRSASMNFQGRISVTEKSRKKQNILVTGISPVFVELAIKEYVELQSISHALH